MRARSGASWGLIGCVALATLGGACELVLDLPDSHLRAGQGGAGGTGGSETGGTGSGTGGASLCAPGATAPCYTGPSATEGVGICKAGTKTCNAEGTAYGDCSGDVKPGVEDCTKPEDEDCSGFACGQPLWAKDYPGQFIQKVTGVAVDSAGNIVVAGILTGSAIFVAKFAADGTHIWSERFGDGLDQFSRGIAVDHSGNVLVTGSFKGTIDFGGGALQSAGGSDGFVAKLDATGAYVWAKRFGDPALDEYEFDLAADSAGNAILVGTFGGSLDFGAGAFTTKGGSDIIVAKLAALDGTQVWAKQFGDASEQTATSVAVDSSGDVIFGGVMAGTVSFGGPAITGAGVYVAKLDASGGPSWSGNFGGTPTAVDLAVDVNGNVAVGGSFNGTLNFGAGAADLVVAGTGHDLFLAKLTPNGKHIWSKDIVTVSGQKAPQPQVGVDKDGNVVIATGLGGAVDFGGGSLTTAGTKYSITLAKLDAKGNHVWSKRFGDGSSSFPVAAEIASDPLSAAVILGAANDGTIDFGTGPLMTMDGLDATLAKFAP
jgi:uncharacterized protein (AIM24 family)